MNVVDRLEFLAKYGKIRLGTYYDIWHLTFDLNLENRATLELRSGDKESIEECVRAIDDKITKMNIILN